MGAKNYYQEVSTTGGLTYSALHIEVQEACNRISSIPSYYVSDVMSKIDDTFKEIKVVTPDNWQGDLSGMVESALEDSSSALNWIILSIASEWSSAESTYKELLQNLDTLKQNSEAYITLWNNVPKKEDYTDYTDVWLPLEDGTLKRYSNPIFHRDSFVAAYNDWQQKEIAAREQLQTLTKVTIDGQIKELMNFSYQNDNTFQLGANGISGSLVPDFENILSNIYLNNALPQDDDLEWFQQFFGLSSYDFFEDGRVRQGGSAPWSELVWGGGRMGSYGCAGVCLAMASMKAASKQYNVDSLFVPIDEFWKHVYEVCGRKNGNYYGSSGMDWTAGEPSKAAIDLSKACNDMIFVEFDDLNGNGIFTAENAKPMTDAGVGLAISLKDVPHDEGHWVSCSGVNELGQGELNDPGYANNEVRYFDENTFRKGSTNNGGQISGQRATAAVPNCAAKVNGEVQPGATIHFDFPIPDGATSVCIGGVPYTVEKVEGNDVTLGNVYTKYYKA